MEKINILSGYIQIALMLGLGVRIIFCFIHLQTAEEEAPKYKKRMKNCIIAAVICQTIFVIKDLLIGYYGGGL